MNRREQLRQAVESRGGKVTREQCQEIARELGMRTINWAFGTRTPLLRRFCDYRGFA
jgi:hypothetical protein